MKSTFQHSMPESDQDDAQERKARCTYYGRKCTSETEATPGLPFFAHKPEKPHDEYYCGCWGWE